MTHCHLLAWSSEAVGCVLLCAIEMKVKESASEPKADKTEPTATVAGFYQHVDQLLFFSFVIFLFSVYVTICQLF